MNIARIQLGNLRSIERLDLDLMAADGSPRRRVVLLGGNGCGKTTTLLAIAHVLGRESADFGAERLGADDIRKVRQETDAASTPERPSGYIDLEVYATGEDQAWWGSMYPKHDAPKHGRLGVEIGMVFAGAAPHARWTPQVEFSAVDLSGKGEHLRSVIAGRIHPPGMFLPATRGALEHTEDISIARLDEFSPRVGCLSRESRRFQLLPSLLALAFMAPERNDRDRMVQRMWQVQKKYFPEMPAPVGVRGLHLLFETADGAVVPLARLSDGQRALLVILGELAVRNPAGGIVLIDELEQHFHPRWQKALLDALVALLPSAQFIITTQSPYLAAAAPDDVITLGDWKRDGAE